MTLKTCSDCGEETSRGYTSEDDGTFLCRSCWNDLQDANATKSPHYW